MTTKQLAIYLIVFMTTVAVLFGFVPPLLNAKSTPLNAVGVAVALAVFFAAALVVHATYTAGTDTQEKSNPPQADNKEQ